MVNSLSAGLLFIIILRCMRTNAMRNYYFKYLTKDDKEAEQLAASGKITFDPCHHHQAVGPMAGIVS